MYAVLGEFLVLRLAKGWLRESRGWIKIDNEIVLRGRCISAIIYIPPCAIYCTCTADRLEAGSIKGSIAITSHLIELRRCHFDHA